jgi:hypothetical protein
MITEVEMIRSGLVKVDCLLHKSKAKHTGVKVDVLLRATGNRRYVMNAKCFRHDVS